ncbi:hypothetical protein M0R45_009616 [Rubus argutus]|uniref:ABC transporter domain-containing protein n=1 Tax=Rubus argutus TaxID=59490 RepID=A0AAW1Y561_RUBAR
MEMGRDLKLDIGSAGILQKRRRSFEKDSETPSHGKVIIQKTQSLGSQLLVNVEEGLIDTVPINYGFETRSAGSSLSNNGFRRYSFSVSGGDISDHIALRVQSQSPKLKDTISTAQSTATEEDTNVDEGRRLNTEATLPIYLKFQDVKYKIAAKGVKSSTARCLLQGITGSVNPGEILALMGPSGGGKTTLLNVLSGRAKLNGGTVTYNDQPYTKSLKQVKETLTYAALLRLPINLTKTQKKERAMHVINELGLERCQDTIIGGTFYEPTSGLDSTAAFRVLQMLHIIAEAGKTVVTTIHQPSSRIFNKFDKLILLGRGSSLYFGKASEAMMHFSSIGCAPLIAMNPAEFLIDLANGNTNEKSLPTEFEDGGPSADDVHEFLVEANQDRLAKMENKKLLNSVMLHHGEHLIQGKSHLKESKATWWEQFSVLFQRGLKERRHEYFSCMRVIQVISTAIIVGLLWWHSNASSPKQPSRSGKQGYCLHFSILGLFPLFTAIFTFPQERAMLAKERAVEMYKLSSYFLARNTSDLPLDLLLPIVFLVIVYMMVGLKLTFACIFSNNAYNFLSIVAAQGLGLSIGAAFIDLKKATTFGSVIVMTFMLSGGFFIQKVPSVISWVRYISFNYHTYRLLLKIQYGCSSSDSGSGTAGYEPCESPFIKELRIDFRTMKLRTMI